MSGVIEILLEEVAKNRAEGEQLEAFKVIVEILSLEPDNLPAQIAWTGLFDCLSELATPEVFADWTRQLGGSAPGCVLHGLLHDSSTCSAPDEALADYAKAIRLNRDCLLAYYYRGNYSFSCNRFKRAVNDFTRCLEIAPQFLQALYDRSEAYGAMEDYQAAIADLIAYNQGMGGNQLWVSLQIAEYLSQMDEK
jgi:tetratricopeptide (TPR) repeat protein